MRSMTVEQAKLFIAAGYFPKANEIEAISDLQDAFGHLPYKFIIATLVDEALNENAVKLYSLIWGSEEVARCAKKAFEYLVKIETITQIEAEIVEMEKTVKRLKRETEGVISFL